jgi:hypothetical protein
MAIVYWRGSPIGVMASGKPSRPQHFATSEEAWIAVAKHRLSALSIFDSGKSYAGSEIDDELERRSLT